MASDWNEWNGVPGAKPPGQPVSGRVQVWYAKLAKSHQKWWLTQGRQEAVNAAQRAEDKRNGPRLKQ